MTHAFIKSIYRVLIHLNECFLAPYVFKGLRVNEQDLKKFKESVRVEFQKPREELLISCEPHNIIDVDPPLESWQRALGEFLSFQEQFHKPN